MLWPVKGSLTHKAVCTEAFAHTIHVLAQRPHRQGSEVKILQKRFEASVTEIQHLIALQSQHQRLLWAVWVMFKGVHTKNILCPSTDERME